MACNQKITLRKVYKESWVKKRGSAEKELTGHTIDHFLNGVPTKAGEYSAAISLRWQMSNCSNS